MLGRPTSLLTEEDYAIVYARLVASRALALAESLRWIVHDLRGNERSVRLIKELANASELPSNVRTEIAAAIATGCQLKLTPLLHISRDSAIALKLALRFPALRDTYFPDLAPWPTRLRQMWIPMVGLLTVVVAILKAL